MSDDRLYARGPRLRWRLVLPRGMHRLHSIQF
jgi:hypothetical protein